MVTTQADTSLFDLTGRTALVTGASRGIGRAIAVGLGRAGADIVAFARSEASLADLGTELRGLGRSCHMITGDVTSEADRAALFAQLAGAGVTPDILINNAGIEEVCASAKVPGNLWDRIVDTNLRAAFFVAQGFARAAMAAGRPASIINICSLTSAVGVPTAAPYTASKSGLLGLTRALATEWAGDRIRVNAIGPGYFQTDLTGAFFADPGWQERMLERVPMGRFGALDDLVGVSVFLAGPASAYVTGQILYVDGGYLAAI